MSIIYGTYDLEQHALDIAVQSGRTRMEWLPGNDPMFTHAQDFGAKHRRLNELALADELEQRAEMWGMDA